MPSATDKNHDTSLFPLCPDRATDDPPIDNDIDLNSLTQEVVRGSESLVEWYREKIVYRRAWARTLRFLMVLFASIAFLIPLLAEVVKKGDIPLISPGFSAVFLAFSGITYAIEKCFGHGNAWIRFVKAKLAIEAKIEQLKLQWLQLKLEQKMGKSPDVSSWLSVLKEHQQSVSELVEGETDNWIKEFQTIIGEKKALGKHEVKHALR